MLFLVFVPLVLSCLVLSYLVFSICFYLLGRYQFTFDDETVDYRLVECLLRYVCRSAYEDGAVLVFLPGWDDITRRATV